MDKSFLIYPERCIACRACQVACKQWNQLPAEATTNQGSYENPGELSFYTYTKIHFRELKTAQGMQWLFLKRQCYHCTEAACLLVCPVEGAVSRTDEGAVVLNQDLCIGCKYCVNACPFGVPQFNQSTRKVSKCNFCQDRLERGLSPACSQACPTGAICYGERKSLLQQARRLGYQSIYGENELKGMHVMFALKDSAQAYGLPSSPQVPTALWWWKRLLSPLWGWAAGAALFGSLTHYLLHRSSHREEAGESGS